MGKNLLPLLIGSVLSIGIILLLLIEPSGYIDKFKMSKNLIDHVQVLTFIGLLINIWFLQITYKQNQKQIQENRNNLIKQQIDKNFFILFNNFLLLKSNNHTFYDGDLKNNITKNYKEIIDDYLLHSLHDLKFNRVKVEKLQIDKILEFQNNGFHCHTSFYIITMNFLKQINLLLNLINNNSKIVDKSTLDYYYDIIITNLSIGELNLMLANESNFEVFKTFFINNSEKINIPTEKITVENGDIN
ncbi:hypothetical protein [Empedobacter falsenii]